MKITIKGVLITLLWFFINSSTFAQSGWVEGNAYLNQGGRNLTCGSFYNVNRTDGINYWNETWQDCREMVWFSQYYEGYVYIWGPNGWYTEFRSGNYWYYNWRNFSTRIM